ncbi:hypothetical protein [Alicyclobacillus sp.]|uniref:hypothetical protein n=1 Tax=Alicyclobacillus sp. TaxID=61169 RepID=UPI0025BB5654|nr:hypothetical protein [Alicyclobacillus sp.]MCL6515614.1 hypothetical protein [Alicyclobacillus sp.]
MIQTLLAYLVLALMGGAAWWLARRMKRAASPTGTTGRGLNLWPIRGWAAPVPDQDDIAREAERVADVLEDIHRQLAADGRRLRQDVAVALERLDEAHRAELDRLHQELSKLRARVAQLEASSSTGELRVDAGGQPADETDTLGAVAEAQAEMQGEVQAKAQGEVRAKAWGAARSMPVDPEGVWQDTFAPEPLHPGASGLVWDAERGFRILEAWQAGLSPEEIAERVGVSRAEVRHVVELMTRPGTDAM